MLTRETLASLSIDGLAHYVGSIGDFAILEAGSDPATLIGALIVVGSGRKYRCIKTDVLVPDSWVSDEWRAEHKAPVPKGWDYL